MLSAPLQEMTQKRVGSCEQTPNYVILSYLDYQMFSPVGCLVQHHVKTSVPQGGFRGHH